MKKLRTLLAAVLNLFVILIAGHALAAPALSTDIALDVPKAFTASSIRAVGAGLYCVAGFVYHDEVPNASALVLLVDTNEGRVVWKAAIPFAKEHYENTATNCLREGEAYYVLTEEHTSSRPDQNQTELVLNKLSDTGKLLATRQLDVGFDVWANRFQAGEQGVSIVGGASSDSLSRGGKRSLFLARFDDDLSRKQLIVLPTGAFWAASAKLDGQSLLIAGEFLPNAGAGAAAHEGCAVSKVDLGKARYVWSTYVYPLDVQAQHALFLPDGGTAYVGMKKDHLVISMIDRAGRVTRRWSAPRSICTVDALGLKGPALQVVGTSCADRHATLLLDVDSTTGDIASSRQIGSDIAAVSFDEDSIAVVSGESWTDPKVFSRMAR
jgi:hypothetical protein